MVKASLSREYVKKISRGMGAADIKPIRRVSTTNVGLDYISTGGFPAGRITELAGPTHSWKSTTALFLHKVWFEQHGWIGSYSDVEGTVSLNDVKRLGLNTDAIDFLYPSSSEMFLAAVQQAAQLKIESDPEKASDYYSLMTLDSVATLSPLAQQEIIEARLAKDEAVSSMAVRQALFWSAIQSSLTSYIQDSDLTVLFINQARQNRDPYGTPIITPGGAAIPYMCSLRMLSVCSGKPSEEAQKIKGLEDSVQVKWKVTKNKTGENKREIVLDYTKTGPDPYTALLRVAKKVDVIQNSGAAYKIHPAVADQHKLEEKFAHGFSNAYDTLKDPSNEELYKLLYQVCLEKAETPFEE